MQFEDKTCIIDIYSDISIAILYKEWYKVLDVIILTIRKRYDSVNEVNIITLIMKLKKKIIINLEKESIVNVRDRYVNEEYVS